MQPPARNGLTGLRPTFGRVSRHGGMTLAWTQDTVGPTVPLGRRLRAGVRRDLRSRRQGQHGARRAVRMGRRPQTCAKLRVGYLRFGVGGRPRAGETARRLGDASEQRGRPAGDPRPGRARWCRSICPTSRWRRSTSSARRRRRRRSTSRLATARSARSRTVPSRARRPADIRAGAFHPGGRVHPGEPLSHARDGTNGRRDVRPRPLPRGQWRCSPIGLATPS